MPTLKIPQPHPNESCSRLDFSSIKYTKPLTTTSFDNFHSDDGNGGAID